MSRRPDPLDRTWRVRRRWLPWRRRVRDIPDSPIDVGPLGDDPISAIIGLFLLILAIPALIVTVLLLAELLLLLLLLPIAVVIRLLLPVPWRIEVRWRPRSRRVLGWIEAYEEPCVGWAESRARIAQVRTYAQSLGRGEPFLPPVWPDGSPARGQLMNPAPGPPDGDGPSGERPGADLRDELAARMDDRQRRPQR